MTDRELLELAAKAAGLQIHTRYQAERDAMGFGHVGFWLTNGTTCWNPLTDDGDALRLAVKLNITVFPDGTYEGISFARVPDGFEADEQHRGDPYAATRRAIVRAAAAIGQSLAATDSGDSR